MVLNKTNRKIYSNILTKKINHVVPINATMVIKKEIMGHKKVKKTGELEAIYELKLNVDYWKNIKEPISCVLDEAHAIINARRVMSKANIIITDWLSLLRRVLGATESGYGELVLITQLPNRIDIIAREMAQQIRYHICHYIKTCKECDVSWRENSEMPEILWSCPSCNSSKVLKHSHQIEIWKFYKINNFQMWKDYNMKTFYSHYIVNDIEKYFPMYNTLQWDNLFSEYY